uniref:Uncharacterized protein n=1 Tax=Picea glauca TaxID=3330 RepID=A0A101LZ30_PICGL|nr:hypothetical protein ABT39_MTgene4974 [Picea glauca]QHR86599.1 hypothetical protein Q903MT_gene602 [Picea sitchensis]
MKRKRKPSETRKVLIWYMSLRKSPPNTRRKRYCQQVNLALPTSQKRNMSLHLRYCPHLPNKRRRNPLSSQKSGFGLSPITLVSVQRLCCNEIINM